ncbi:MAG: hypothetical protein U1G05_10345 [Kiritimatiellia bacterium]
MGTREPVQVIHASTDRAGGCGLTLADGTYGLAVAGKTVALIEAADMVTTHLRLVTPRKPLLIGGAEKTAKRMAKEAAPTNAVPTNVVADATGDAAGAGEAGHEGGRRGLFAWIGDNGLKTALLLGGVVATGIIMEDENDGPSRAETPAAGGGASPASPRASRPSRPTTPDIDPPVSR